MLFYDNGLVYISPVNIVPSISSESTRLAFGYEMTKTEFAAFFFMTLSKLQFKARKTITTIVPF